jgi:hypothetical protein
LSIGNAGLRLRKPGGALPGHSVAMCFSATASLVASAGLLAVGGVTVRSVSQRRQRLYAAIPLLFAAQQFIEGLIWLTAAEGPAGVVSLLAWAYAVFAVGVWPVYVPLAVLVLEPRGPRRRVLMGLLMVGLGVAGWLLAGAALDGLAVRAADHHLDYFLPAGQFLPVAALYIAATAGSLLLSSHWGVRAFGLLALLSCAAAYAAYAAWFVSVWCYFAGVLSIAVLLQVRVQPRWMPVSA